MSGTRGSAPERRSATRRRHDSEASQDSRGPRFARLASVVLVGLVVLTRVPIASAHGSTATGGLTRGHALLAGLLGLAVLGGTLLAKRTGRVSPTTAIYGVFAGVAVVVVGAIFFEGLSPDPTYTASSMPFPRAWYRPLGLVSGLSAMVVSLAVGWLRWPTRPRYTVLGILLGLWVAYPYLVPGPAGDTHPLGYAIVLGTPILVGYVLWRDVRTELGAVVRDPVARRFGIGIGVVLGLFFLSITGYLSFFPEEGVPHERVVAVLPAIYQLVSWPVLEVYLPHVPLFIALSPGQLVVVGMLSVLVGLNAALIARQWRLEEQAGFAQGTAGSAAIVGSCTCGCCGPLAAKLAVVAAGPSVAAPVYWVFVDTASPLSVAFVVASIGLFTGSLIYSVESARLSTAVSEPRPAD